MAKQLLSAFYRNCRPEESLPPGDSRYVPFEMARGDTWRQEVARAFDLSDRPLTQLLAGFIGDGKTTELYRLKRDLEDRGLAVAYVDALAYTDPNDYSVLDVLLAIISGTADALRVEHNVELHPSFLAQRWAELKATLFTDIELEKLSAEISGGPVSLAAELRLVSRDTRVRATLWDALGSQRTTLANEFSGLVDKVARPAIIASGLRNLVVLVDGLEKLRQDRTGQALRRLFIDHGPVLADLGVHLLLTIPVSLAYSTDAGALADVYGSRLAVIPTLRVPDSCQRFCGTAAQERAMEVMREVVRRRVPTYDGTLDDPLDAVFCSSDILDQLITFSGGHVRTLLILLRETILREMDGRIGAKAVEITRKDWIRAKDREVRARSRRAAASHVNETYTLPAEPDLEEAAMELLQGTYILVYRNELEFYGLLPALNQALDARLKQETGEHGVGQPR